MGQAKNLREGMGGFKNTLACSRASGYVYNYKALQRVAGEPAVLQTSHPTGSRVFIYIHIFLYLLLSFVMCVIIYVL